MEASFQAESQDSSKTEDFPSLAESSRLLLKPKIPLIEKSRNNDRTTEMFKSMAIKTIKTMKKKEIKDCSLILSVFFCHFSSFEVCKELLNIFLFRKKAPLFFLYSSCIFTVIPIRFENCWMRVLVEIK